MTLQQAQKIRDMLCAVDCERHGFFTRKNNDVIVWYYVDKQTNGCCMYPDDLTPMQLKRIAEKEKAKHG